MVKAERKRGHSNQICRICVFVILWVLLCFLFPALCQEEGPVAWVNGNNFLQVARGDKDIEDTDTEKPWNYLTDYLNFEANIRHFFIRGCFQVDNPSLGFYPPKQIFQEFFSRRSVGFNGEYVTIEGGHSTTVFGRGLILSLQEDKKTEKPNVLDGIFLTANLPWMTIQALAGRGLRNKLTPYEINAISLISGNVVISQNLEDLNFRDNIIGLFIESYPFQSSKALSFLSATSLGGGIAYYGRNVSDVQAGQKIVSIDTSGSEPDTTFGILYYQNKADIFLPSLFANFSFDHVEFSFEGSQMFHKRHQYNDTLYKNDTLDELRSYAYYSSIGLNFFDIYFLLEYKNYFYLLNKNPGYYTVKDYVEPSDCRYKHSWKLLTKHVQAKVIDDVVGYNTSLTWSHFDPATVTLAFNIGGKHSIKDSSDTDTSWSAFGFSDEKRYWELHSEWEQRIKEWLTSKLFFNIGDRDPDKPHYLERSFGTLINLGPFHEKHSLDIQAEAQINTREFNADTDSSAFTTVNNIYIKLTYNLSPWLTLYGILEKETHFVDNFIQKTGIVESKENFYKSLGIGFNPHPRHSLFIEFGSFSGGKICSPPPCTYVPAFRGVKFQAVSTF